MSLEIALEKIRREAEEKKGYLDIGNLGLEEIPDELFSLTHLKGLCLNRNRWNSAYEADFSKGTINYRKPSKNKVNTFPSSDSRLAQLANLEVFICVGGDFSNLEFIQYLSAISSINCSTTQVCDLKPLKDLVNLNSLDCSSTQVSDLNPLKDLVNLNSLNCSYTQVSDFTPLKDCLLYTSPSPRDA